MAAPSWTLSFVPAGTALDRPLPDGTIAVDVGNGEPEEGIFDHHHRPTEAKSAVERVLRHREHVLARLQSSDTRTLIGHQQPDFDCLTSLFFVWSLGTDPDRTNPDRTNPERTNPERTDSGHAAPTHFSTDAWMRVAGDADQGRTALTGGLTLYACATVLRAWLRQAPGWRGTHTAQAAAGLGVQYAPSSAETQDACTAIWFIRLLDVWTRRGRAPDALLSPDAVPAPLDELVRGTKALLDRAQRRCHADRKRAVAAGDAGVMPVPMRNGHQTKAPYVRVVDPTARAGFLARALRRWGRHAYGKPAVTIIQFSDAARTVVSVDPESRFTLFGLGRALEAMEQAARQRRGVSDEGPPRFHIVAEDGTEKVDPDFSSSDPWYDGRGHRYTIVDAPRNGSLLPLDTIYRCVVKGAWIEE